MIVRYSNGVVLNLSEYTAEIEVLKGHAILSNSKELDDFIEKSHGDYYHRWSIKINKFQKMKTVTYTVTNGQFCAICNLADVNAPSKEAALATRQQMEAMMGGYGIERGAGNPNATYTGPEFSLKHFIGVLRMNGFEVEKTH